MQQSTRGSLDLATLLREDHSRRSQVVSSSSSSDRKSPLRYTTILSLRELTAEQVHYCREVWLLLRNLFSQRPHSKWKVTSRLLLLTRCQNRSFCQRNFSSINIKSAMASNHQDPREDSRLVVQTGMAEKNLRDLMLIFNYEQGEWSLHPRPHLTSS